MTEGTRGGCGFGFLYSHTHTLELAQKLTLAKSGGGLEPVILSGDSLCNLREELHSGGSLRSLGSKSQSPLLEGTGWVLCWGLRGS